jgi:hypothetical protein
VLIESIGYSIGLQHFFKWASEEETSPLQGKNVASLCGKLLNNASTAPIPAPGCDGTSCRTDVNAEELFFNAQEALIFNDPRVTEGLSTWCDLASAIHKTTQCYASALSTRFDSTSTAVGTPVYCLDHDHDSSTYDFRYMQAKQHMFVLIANYVHDILYIVQKLTNIHELTS